jgi:hypothetical protein
VISVAGFQLTSLPAKGATANARVQAASASQAGVLSELRQVHATHVRSYHIINAVSATISAAEATRLQHDSAESIGASAHGSTLLVNQASLNATVNAGQNATFNVSVTNEGTGSQTVTPTVSGRPTTVSNDTGSVVLSSSSPTNIDGEGRTDFYALHTFSVPAGAGNLNGDITWNDQSIGGVAFETLFDPQGNVAAYSLIGTNQSGFGHVEVHNPMAGTWTAVIFTVSNAPYFGPVKFAYFTQNFHPAGTVSRTKGPPEVRAAPSAVLRRGFYVISRVDKAMAKARACVGPEM